MAFSSRFDRHRHHCILWTYHAGPCDLISFILTFDVYFSCHHVMRELSMGHSCQSKLGHGSQLRQLGHDSAPPNGHHVCGQLGRKLGVLHFSDCRYESQSALECASQSLFPINACNSSMHRSSFIFSGLKMLHWQLSTAHGHHHSGFQSDWH